MNNQKERGVILSELLISVVLASILSISVSLSYNSDIRNIVNISVEEKKALLSEYFDSAFDSIERCLDSKLSSFQRNNCINVRTAFSRLATLGVKENLYLMLEDDFLLDDLSRGFMSELLIDIEVDKNGSITAKEFSSAVGSYLDDITALASEHSDSKYTNDPDNIQIDFPNLNEFLLGIMLSKVNETATEARIKQIKRELKDCRKDCTD